MRSIIHAYLEVIEMGPHPAATHPPPVRMLRKHLAKAMIFQPFYNDFSVFRALLPGIVLAYDYVEGIGNFPMPFLEGFDTQKPNMTW